MKSLYSETFEIYDGQQLISLHNYLKHGLLGDSVVAWVGGCEIPFEHMADGEDLRAQSPIRGARMLHFIFEIFDCSLLAAVAVQRLFASLVADEVRAVEPRIYRDGDDIYLDKLKLSISIATVSPTSALIHFAINVTNEGTPVPTLSLEDLKLEPKALAERLFKRFTAEFSGIRDATKKVRWVK